MRSIMKGPCIVFGFGLLIGLGIEFAGAPTTAQTTSPKEAQPPTSGSRILTHDDASRAQELIQAMAAALKADRWDEAIARGEELLAVAKRIRGPKHFETMNVEWELNALRAVGRTPKEDRVAYHSARTMSEQSLAVEAQGKYAQAQPLYEKALEIRRRLLTDDHPQTASSYSNLACNLNRQGKYAAAQPLFERALEIRRRLLTDDHPDTASSYSNVAHNLDAQAKYAQAQPLHEKALEIRRRLLTDNHPDTAQSWNSVAGNLGDQAKYAQAQPLYEKALEINRRLLTDNHPATAGSYNNVAYNLGAQGKYAQAQPLYEKALEINRRLLTDDHPRTAASYNNLAAILNAQGKYAQAQPLFERALEIRRRVLPDNHPDTAASYNNLAAILNAQGKYAQAQPLLEKALEIHRGLLSDDHPGTATNYNNLAANLSAQGKYAQAQPLYEKALEIRRGLLTDNHPDTADSYYNLAANLSEQGKYLEARARWKDAARSQDAVRLRVAFTGMERAGTERIERAALAAVSARLGQPAEASQSLEENLGRGLLDELAARQDHRLAPAERVRLHELTAELERLDRLTEMMPTGLDQAARASRFDSLNRTRERASIALGEFQAKLVEAYGPLAGHVDAISEIQAALPADAALVAWVDIPPVGPAPADPDGEHWGVVVRARGIPSWVAITGTDPDGLWNKHDTELAARVRTALRGRPSASGELGTFLRELHSQRLEPLAKALGGAADGLPPARRLIVLPSRAIAGIPVEALLAPDDTRTVSYAPSGTVFKYLREQPRPDGHKGLLALGDPVCVPPLPGTRYEVEKLAELFQADNRPTRALLGADASEPEIDRLTSSGELGRFGFIHLATHGVIDEATPELSAVILTQTGLPHPLLQAMSHKPVFDGQLSVREIQRGWDLKAELVTLSACETALGRDVGGEGFVGFTQALLMSGARSVCLSLWQVNDVATALLMQRFYANLLGRRPGLASALPKAEALAEAKRWLRSLQRSEVRALLAQPSGGVARAKDAPARQPSVLPAGGDNDQPFASPQFWAAFVLVGDPD
jgi:CHAT domain-containing protein/tetratricopeptide (TPR) repeat protein